jgi:hypothetical protein
MNSDALFAYYVVGAVCFVLLVFQGDFKSAGISLALTALVTACALWRRRTTDR